MELPVLLLIAFVVLLIGISKSAFAGALGVFAVPLLMLKLPATQAIAIMLPLLIIADAMSLRSFWRKWDVTLLKRLIPGAILGVIFANFIIDFIDPSYLRVVIALLCIVFALKNIVFKNIELEFLKSTFGAYLMSASSGVSSTLVHAGGPPLIMYFTAIKLPQAKFVATAAAFFAVMNIGKLIGALSFGLLSIDIALTALAFAPVAFFGNWVGVYINKRLNKVLFLKIMNYILLLLGLWLIIN
ncbi:sulfite exporter TauE/SafE family protein [Pseudoalteromonas arctica]|uniref:sulfite exporter TauE/SafE family protein n=1 Tax=Pseudoalteromonas arctica TaxID=394751 RepID=UPI0024950CC3|nr:sulfite exporter TauE/SafE family protein [Pseudoalteromonas arctica]